ncbi:hypothetical protein CEXT_360541 [Caerostris extrusa]|uniref:Uncharacterized protein n=1 Tax=Caerostris extrusa TaxID=172846 RepID=A0AAV4W443_CAEEX|nr:hypothetical protein CEXT_360541 [Caerostris extrusa]
MSDPSGPTSSVEPVQALSNFAASPDSAHSPIGHRTRQQSKIKHFTSAGHDQDVINTVSELVSAVSCVPPNVSPVVCSRTKALDNFEACLNSSFSPVCHRTRRQLANREIFSVQSEIDSSPIPCDFSNVSQLVESAIL